jgi:uncharacterized membrane protein YcgQ (UPF0703/DUF1980 family)
MDPAQIILVAVISILAILLVILGVQVFLILKELRKTVSKANKVLDSTSVIAQSVSSPIASLSSIAEGIKTGTAFMNIVKKFVSKKEEGKKNNE